MKINTKHTTENMNWGTKVHPDYLYPVNYLIKPDGNKLFGNFELKGSDMTENQIIELFNNPYKTACEGINPDNPMAVAENLKQLFDLSKLLSGTIVYKGKYFTKAELQRLDRLIILLTKMQSK